MSAISTFLKNRRCAKTRSLLSAYIDGETSASESRRVQEHLVSCAGCAAELESLQATAMLLGRLPQLEPPRSYALTAADVEEAAPQFRFPSFETFVGGLATAGAASLVVVLVVGLVFLARLGFIGSSDQPAPAAAAPAAPAAPGPAGLSVNPGNSRSGGACRSCPTDVRTCRRLRRQLPRLLSRQYYLQFHPHRQRLWLRPLQ